MMCDARVYMNLIYSIYEKKNELEPKILGYKPLIQEHQNNPQNFCENCVA